MNSLNIQCISLIIEFITSDPLYIMRLREISNKWNNTIEFYSPNTWSRSNALINKRLLNSRCLPIFKIIIQNNITFNFLNAVINSRDDDFVFYLLDFIDKDYLTTDSRFIEHICKKNLIKSCKKLTSFGISSFGHSFHIALYASCIIDYLYRCDNYNELLYSIVKFDNDFDYDTIKLLLNADCPVPKNVFFSIIHIDHIDLYKLIIVKQFNSIDDRINAFIKSITFKAKNIFLFLVDTYKYNAFNDPSVSDFIHHDWPEIIPHIMNDPIRKKIIYS